MSDNITGQVKPAQPDPALAQQDIGIITLWSLRILLRLNSFDRFFDRYGIFENAEALQSIGLHDFYYDDRQDERKRPERAELKQKLNARLAQLSRDSRVTAQDIIFSRSVGILRKALSLTSADTALLHFVSNTATNSGFSFILDAIGDLNYRQTKHALSVILNVLIADVEKSLGPDSVLLSSGLLSVTPGEGHSAKLHNRFELPKGIGQALTKEHRNDSSMLQCFFRISPKARPSTSLHVWRPWCQNPEST